MYVKLLGLGDVNLEVLYKQNYLIITALTDGLTPNILFYRPIEVLVGSSKHLLQEKVRASSNLTRTMV